MSVALTIAGSDPSGGAGLQADLKTFQRFDVYGTSVVTLLTVQNTQSVAGVSLLEADFVTQQLDAVLADIPPVAAKTGALGSAAIIAAVASRAQEFSFPLVVDPVMISKHGHALIDDAAIDELQRSLLPSALVVTPNRFEAARLVGFEVVDRESMETAAVEIAALGPNHVVIKGLSEPQGSGNCSVDLHWSATEGSIWLSEPLIDQPSNHGSGCVFSAAITAELARGASVAAAVRAAKSFVAAAIRNAPGLGHGIGPLNFFASP